MAVNDKNLQSIFTYVEVCFHDKSMALVHCKDEQDQDVFVLARLILNESGDFDLEPLARLFLYNSDIAGLTPVPKGNVRVIQQSIDKTKAAQEAAREALYKDNQQLN